MAQQPSESVSTGNPSIMLPNVLLIVADDLPRNILGAYGASHGLTPTMDRLARFGLTFENAYTTAPLCTPSRYGILTGMYASTSEGYERPASDATNTIRAIKFNVALRDQANATMAGRLRKQGYMTGFIGKWHIGNTDQSPRGVSQLEPSHRDQQESIRREGGFDVADDIYWSNPSLDAYAHNPEWMAFIATRFMHRAAGKGGRPFFLYMAPTLPHEPLKNIAEQLQSEPRPGPPGLLVSSSSARSIEQHAFMLDARALRQQVVTKLKQANLLCPAGSNPNNLSICSIKKLPALSTLIAPAPWLPTDLSTKEVALVVSAASWLDATLTSVLEQAELASSSSAAGLLTIISADHGPGWAGKGQPYEAGIRVPLIMKMPARWQASTPQRWHGRVTHLDLLPTIVTIGLPTIARESELDARPRVHGNDLTAMLRQIARGGTTLEPKNTTIFVEVGYARALLTSRWKLIVVTRPPLTRPGCISFQGTPMESYIASFNGGNQKPKQPLMYDGYRHHFATYCDPVQLFDLNVDPAESHNLASQQPDVTSELGVALQAFIHWAEPGVSFTSLGS